VQASLGQRPAAALLQRAAAALQGLTDQPNAAGKQLHGPATGAFVLLAQLVNWYAASGSGSGSNSDSSTNSGSGSGSGSGTNSGSRSRGRCGSTGSQLIALAVTQESVQLAWSLAELLPAATAVLRRVAADPSCPPDSVGSMCFHLSASLQLLRHLRGVSASPAQLAVWAAAADAGLLLQPLLAQLSRQPGPERQQGSLEVQRLSLALIEDVWRCAPEGRPPAAEPGQQGQAAGQRGQAAGQQHQQADHELKRIAAAARAGARLVQTSCRLAHWLLAGGELAGWGSSLSAASCAMVQGGIADLFYYVAYPLMVRRHCHVPDRPVEHTVLQLEVSSRHNRMMAMCQAVWAALHALTSAYPSCPAVAVPRVGSRLPRPTGAVRVGCVSRTGGGAHWQHLRPPASCPRRGDVHATAAGCTGCSRHPKPAPHCHSIGRATLPTVLLVWCALHACCACLGSLWYSLQATVPCCT
jgi:hypothetical protein